MSKATCDECENFREWVTIPSPGRGELCFCKRWGEEVDPWEAETCGDFNFFDEGEEASA